MTGVDWVKLEMEDQMGEPITVTREQLERLAADYVRKARRRAVTSALSRALGGIAMQAGMLWMVHRMFGWEWTLLVFFASSYLWSVAVIYKHEPEG